MFKIVISAAPWSIYVPGATTWLNTDSRLLLGRKDNDGLTTVQMDAGGNLQFRPGNGVYVTSGYRPIGTYAEFQLINTEVGTASGGDKYKQEAVLDLLGRKPAGSGRARNGCPWGTPMPSGDI